MNNAQVSILSSNSIALQPTGWNIAESVPTTLKVYKNWLGLVTDCPFLPNVGILGKVLGDRCIFCLVLIPDTDATLGNPTFLRCQLAPVGTRGPD